MVSEDFDLLKATAVEASESDLEKKNLFLFLCLLLGYNKTGSFAGRWVE